MQNKYDTIMRRINCYYVREDQHLLPTEDDIRNFEQQVGFQLPRDYKHFLSKYGLNAGKDITRIEVFYGVCPEDTYDLKDNWDAFSEDLPPFFLAIASCPGGQIVISLAGDEAGGIFWWGQHRGSPNPHDDLELLAFDFDSFMQTLTVCKE